MSFRQFMEGLHGVRAPAMGIASRFLPRVHFERRRMSAHPRNPLFAADRPGTPYPHPPHRAGGDPTWGLPRKI